jgi:hypothetical protein
MKSIKTRWTRRPAERKAPRRKKADLNLERLETKQLLSWTSVPDTFGWPSSYDASFVSNGRSGYNSIVASEVDVYRFVAPRSGNYTFKAERGGAERDGYDIDTIAGVYTWSGNRLGGNDDDRLNGTTDSQFTTYLTGGVQYAYAITNHQGHANGPYRWEIDGPPLELHLVTHPSSGFISDGYASLKGNTLYAAISGENNTFFTSHIHRIDVYLVNSNNRPIHTGSWSVSTKTYGRILGSFYSLSGKGQYWDVSNMDLRSLRNIQIVVT